MDEKISAKEAYMAMFAFLDELYRVYEFDQLGGLLGSMTMLPDGMPADAAIWDDWVRCMSRAKSSSVDTSLRIVDGGNDFGGTDA